MSGYCKPFRAADSELFVSGASFEDVVALYLFDKRLRLMMMDALERIEVAVRAEIAAQMGAKNPQAHLEFDYFWVESCDQKSLDASLNAFDAWRREEQKIRNRRDEIVNHHDREYGTPPPIWASVELWSFGMLARFYKLMRRRPARSGDPFRRRQEIFAKLAGRDGFRAQCFGASWTLVESGCYLAAETSRAGRHCGIRSAADERQTSVRADILGFVRRRFFVAPYLPAVGMAASVAPSNGRFPCRAGAKFEGDGIPAGMEKQQFLESINRLCVARGKPIFSPLVPNSYKITRWLNQIFPPPKPRLCARVANATKRNRPATRNRQAKDSAQRFMPLFARRVSNSKSSRLPDAAKIARVRSLS